MKKVEKEPLQTLSPGRLALGRLKNNKGLTLIEIMITITIVAVIVSMATLSITRLSHLSMKTAAGKLGSTVRYLRAKAISKNTTMKLIFDIEKSSYHVESTNDPFVIQRDSDGVYSEEPEELEEELIEEDLFVEGEDLEESEEVRPTKPQKALFSADDSRILRPVKLPSDVFIKDIWMADGRGKREEGKAFIYFFPSGYVTQTIINLKNFDDETHYSIYVKPYTGRAVIASSYLEADEAN